jgi:hypothetical protein
MTFCWLDQLRRVVWKELTFFSPFCGRPTIRFLKRKLRFARILSNTSAFTYHEDNVDSALRENRLSVPFWPPRHIDGLENFYRMQVFARSGSPITLSWQIPFMKPQGVYGGTGTHGMGRGARKGLKVKRVLTKTPALGLPDVTKPLFLYVHE